MKKWVKLIVLCMFSFVLFFVPVYQNKTCILLICNFIINIAQKYQGIVVLCLIGYRLMECMKKKKIYKALFYMAALCVMYIMWDTRIFADSFIDSYRAITEEVISLAYTVSITIFVAGTLSVFIIYSGMVELVCIILEPIVRPILKLPGDAAVDIVTSFVASSSVGVFITNQFYLKGKYTKREAATIVSNYSVVSLGFMYYIISLTGLEEISGWIILSVMVIDFILGAIMIRIPPLSLIENDYIVNCEATTNLDARKRIDEALEQANDFSIAKVIKTGRATIKFCVDTVLQVIPIYFSVILLMRYTNVFRISSTLFDGIMKLFGVPCAYEILPTMFIGIFEVSLPALFICNMNLPIQTRFFVALLSLVQVIFFTETANAILHSDIPIKFFNLLEIFIIRTILATPIILVIINLLSYIKVF